MTVLVAIIVACFFGFLVPRKFITIYLMVAAACVTVLYFWFDPPTNYDLYRHYQLLDYCKNVSLIDLLTASGRSSLRLLNQYQSDSPVYLVLIYAIAHIPVAHLLPVAVGIVVYVLSIDRFSGLLKFEHAPAWKYVFCLICLLCFLDFRSINGIRNILAYALFAFVVYQDLNSHWNFFVCLIAYILIANIHSSVFIFIGLRLLLLLDKIPFIVMLLISGFSYTFLNLIIRILSIFRSLSFVTVFTNQILRYAGGNITAYNTERIVMRSFVMFIYLAVFLYVQYALRQNLISRNYGKFFVLSMAFTFGAVSQYDLFIRNDMILLFLVMPFIALFVSRAYGSRILLLRFTRYPLISVMCHVALWVGILFSLTYYYLLFYRPMDQYFTF